MRDAPTRLDSKLKKAFNRVFGKGKFPAYLEVGPDGTHVGLDADAGQLEQACEHEGRNAENALADGQLDAAVDAMMRANVARALFNCKMGQDPFRELPYPPNK